MPICVIRSLLFVEGVAEQGAVQDRAPQSQFVSVLDLVANAHSTGQDGDFHVGIRRKAAEDIEIGGVALHRRTKS